MSTQSRKLVYLLRTIWKSPVFGDSFPKDGDENFAMAQFDLNIFNQPHSKLFRAFLDYSEISENTSLSTFEEGYLNLLTPDLDSISPWQEANV